MKSPVRVAIVDDDPRVRESLESLFEAANIEARCYECAEDFLHRQEFAEVSCLITDVRMPGMSGYELRQHLLNAGTDIPTIFVTAHGIDRRSTEALAAGAVTVLEKPFDGEELLEWVAKAIERAA